MADIQAYFGIKGKVKYKGHVRRHVGKVEDSTFFATDMVANIRKKLNESSALPNKDTLPFLQSKLFENNGALLSRLPRSVLKSVYEIMDEMITKSGTAGDRLEEFVNTGKEYKAIFDGIADMAIAKQEASKDELQTQVETLTNDADLDLVRAFAFMGYPLDRDASGKWVRDPNKSNDYGVKIDGKGVMDEVAIQAFLDNYLNVDPAQRKDKLTPQQLFKFYLSQISDKHPNINNTVMNRYRAEYSENNPAFIHMGASVEQASIYQDQDALRSGVMDKIEHLRDGITDDEIANYGFISGKAEKALDRLKTWTDKGFHKVEGVFEDFYEKDDVVDALEAEQSRLESARRQAEAVKTSVGSETATTHIDSIKDRLNAVKEGLHAVNGAEGTNPTSHTAGTPEPDGPSPEGRQEEKIELLNILPEFVEMNEGDFREDLAFVTADFFVKDDEFLGVQYSKYAEEYLAENPEAQPKEIIDAFMESLGEKPSESEPSIIEQLREQDGIMLGSPEAIKSALYRKYGLEKEDHARDKHDEKFPNLLVTLDRIARAISNDPELYENYTKGDASTRKQIVSEVKDDLDKNGQNVSSQPPTAEELKDAQKRWANLARASGAEANMENVGDANNPLSQGYKRFCQDLLSNRDKDIADLRKEGKPVPETPKEKENSNKRDEDQYDLYKDLHPSEGSVTKLQKRLKPYNTKATIKWMEKIMESFENIKVYRVDKSKKFAYTTETPDSANPENTTPEQTEETAVQDKTESGAPVEEKKEGVEEETPTTEEKASDEQPAATATTPRSESVCSLERKNFAIASLPAYSIMDGYVQNLVRIAEKQGLDPNSIVEIQQARDVRFLLEYVSAIDPNTNPNLYGDGKNLGLPGDLRDVVQKYIEDLISGKHTDLDIESWAEAMGQPIPIDPNTVAQLKNGLLALATASSRTRSSDGSVSYEPSGLAVALYGFSSNITQAENGEWTMGIGTKIPQEARDIFEQAKDDNERRELVGKYVEKYFGSPVADMQWLNTLMEDAAKDAAKNGDSLLHQYPGRSSSMQLFTQMSERLMDAMKKTKTDAEKQTPTTEDDGMGTEG